MLETQETKLPLNFKVGSTIGIIFFYSPLIMKNERHSGITLRNYEELIEYILKETDYHIALISHVVWDHDDDREVIGKLLKRYNGDSTISCVMEGNAIPQLKWVISNCKMFIGARTHSTHRSLLNMCPNTSYRILCKSKRDCKRFIWDKNYVVPGSKFKK